ncbi:hypothetical protein [Microbacterium sp.]|uniref:hypothetical protein n=1 Tax=Microbacterium sp. TaxID=51671 RepID=UPI003A8661DC
MPDTPAVLVADAFEVDAGALRRLSQEPLGAGTVTGFRLPDETIVYADTSGLPVPAETGWVAVGEGRLWLHPADPHLPALAPAAFGHATAILLGRLGIRGVGSPQLVGYRPGRRAVLRVPVDGGTVWVKVVRPHRVEHLVTVHARLRDHGLPVPAVRGWSRDGLLVLDPASGTPAIESGADPEEVLDAVDRLRARLSGAPLADPARTSLRARAAWYADLLRRARPDLAATVTATAEAIAQAGPGRQAETIHGDLHLGQLFLGGGDVTGLIDIDTAGVGDGADDSAAFVGHLVASEALTTRPAAAERARALVRAAWARWGSQPQVAELTAAHLLGHAVSADDAVRQQGLIAHARALVDGAEPFAADPGRR